MLLAKERAEMFSGALSLAVGRVGSISRMDELCVSLFCCSSLNILQRLNVARARQKKWGLYLSIQLDQAILQRNRSLSSYGALNTV